MTALSKAKRTRVSESEILILVSLSSISLRISFTALRGTMTPGMPAAPSGSGVSTCASRCPSVATARSIAGPSSSTA